MIDITERTVSPERHSIESKREGGKVTVIIYDDESKKGKWVELSPASAVIVGLKMIGRAILAALS